MIKYILGRVIRKMLISTTRNVVMLEDSKFESGCTLVNVKFGKHSFCGYDCWILNTTIGNFCSIANNVRIGGATHPMHFVSTSPVFLSHRDSVKTKFARHDFNPVIETKIGNDVWIGNGAIIMSGIKIGNGAVIGAGSIVTKDVGDYCIVAGNPAKFIKHRFEPFIMDSLNRTKWWQSDKKKLNRVGKFVNNPDKFIEEFNKD